MFFLVLSNANVKFDSKKLFWRKYTIAKVMLTARQVKLIDKHRILEAVPNKALEIFLLYMATREAPVSIITLYFIKKPLFAALKQDKASTEIWMKYSNFANVFSPDLAMEFSDHTRLHKYSLKLIRGKLLIL